MGVPLIQKYRNSKIKSVCVSPSEIPGGKNIKSKLKIQEERSGQEARAGSRSCGDTQTEDLEERPGMRLLLGFSVHSMCMAVASSIMVRLNPEVVLCHLPRE